MSVSQSVIEILAQKCVGTTFVNISLADPSADPVKTIRQCELELRELIRDELEKEGVAVQRKRKAVVLGDVSAEKVADYLPGNFKAFRRKDFVEIEGYDRAGWTLEDYVIPRLASGLIVATEVK